MSTISIKYATAAMILIRINIVICNAIDVEDSSKRNPESLHSAIAETITNDSDNIAPLPWKTFSKDVSELLSPDIFSQANPFTYLLAKVKSLSHVTWKKIGGSIRGLVHMGQFPSRYTPYAELVSSLISCLCQLNGVEEPTRIVQNTSQSSNLFKPLNMSAMEPELSPLFSPYIFLDNNPPFRLLGEILAMTEMDISKVTIRLKNILQHRLFPRQYAPFTKFLLQFFQFSTHDLRGLKCAIAKIQPTLMVNSSVNAGQLDAHDESKHGQCDLQFHDQPALKTLFSGELDSASTSPTVQQNVADRTVVTPRQKYFHNDVVKFLSPDMFLQTDLFFYFLIKADKLNFGLIQSTNHNLSYYLNFGLLPQDYIPYAELASSLLSCLEELETVNKDIRNARGKIKTYYPPLKFDISTFDPQLSNLFSKDILSKAKNPSIPLLKALIDIPENEITDVVNRLQSIQKNHTFPQLYRKYNTDLRTFLDHKQRLLRLKDDIAEMQRILITTPTSSQITYLKVL